MQKLQIFNLEFYFSAVFPQQTTSVNPFQQCGSLLVYLYWRYGPASNLIKKPIFPVKVHNGETLLLYIANSHAPFLVGQVMFTPTLKNVIMFPSVSKNIRDVLLQVIIIL